MSTDDEPVQVTAGASPTPESVLPEESPPEELAEGGEDLDAPPRRRRWAAWVAAGVAVPLILMVGAFAKGLSPSQEPVRSPLIDKPAPTIDTTSIDGERVSTSSMRGRWVLINMFATWCVPCREEHDDLVRFTDRHRAVGDVAMVQVIFGDSVGAVRQFRAEHGGTWPIIEDPTGVTAVSYGVTGVPETFLIDPLGVVVAKLVGGVTDDGLERLLQQLTGAPGP